MSTFGVTTVIYGKPVIVEVEAESPVEATARAIDTISNAKTMVAASVAAAKITVAKPAPVRPTHY